MPYELRCECSENLTVDASNAGSQITCRCGRTVEIPRLSTLRAMSGEARTRLSADFEVETLLAKNLLPLENHCLECATATTNCLLVQVECERARVVHPKRPWLAILSVFYNPWLALFIYFSNLFENRADERRPMLKEMGKDKIYSLPVRICPACQQQVVTPRDIRRVMEGVPLYARLLAKFPEAKLRRSAGKAEMPT